MSTIVTVFLLWGAACMLASLVITLLFSVSGHYLKFYEDIRRCVANGECPRSDSPLHKTRERITWRIMRYGRVGINLALFLTFLWLSVLAPFVFGVKFCTGKKLSI